MTERYHPPQSGFIRTFELLETTVLDPSKEFVVFEHEAGPETRRKAGVEYGHGSEVPIFTVIERDVDPSTIDATQVPYQTSYRQWVTPGSGVAELVIPQPLDERTRALWGRSQRTATRGGGEDVRLWLAATFLEKAKTPEDLAHVLRFAFLQSAHVVVQRSRLMLGSALQAGIIKSLRLADKPDAYLMPDAINRAIGLLDPSAAKWARDNLQKQLTKALAGVNMSSVRAKQEVGATPTEVMAHGIQLYDDYELLNDSFWIQAGIKEAGNVAVIPEFLTLVHAKLTGPAGRQVMGRIQDRHSTSIGRSYITAILKHYAEDPQRHHHNALRVFKSTHSEGDTEDQKVKLFSLVQEANLLATTHNTNIDRRHGDQRDKYAILANLPAYYAEAFLRVSSIMRDPSSDLRVRTEQLGQDIMHAQIISMIFTKQNHQDAPARANLLLRFPDIDPRRLRVAQEIAGSGLSLRTAVEVVIDDERWTNLLQ